MKPSTPSLLTLTLVFFSGVSISQKCYFGPNMEAPLDGGLMNCSRVDQGRPAPCCFAGSFCMEQNACYDEISRVTYQYGCTDPSYTDDACPKKCDTDPTKSSWTGLFRKGCSEDEKSWACNHPDTCGNGCPKDEGIPWRIPVFNLGSTAECKEGNGRDIRIAFRSQQTDLSQIGKLPAATGAPAPPPAPAPSTSPPSDSLSSKTKLAIGLGAGLGGAILILSAILVGLYLIRRRRAAAAKTTEPAPVLSPQPGAAPPYTPNPSGYPQDHKYGSPEMNQAPGFQAELSADAVMPYHGAGMASPRSELGGGEIVSPVVSPLMGSPGGGMGGFDQKAPVEMPAHNWGR